MEQVISILIIPRDVLAACVLTRLEHRHIVALSRSQRVLRDACDEYYERAKSHMASVVAMFGPIVSTGETLSDLLDKLRSAGLFEPFVKYRHYNDCRHTLTFTVVVREYNVRLIVTCRVQCAIKTQYRSFYLTMHRGKCVTCLYESDLRDLACCGVSVSDTPEDAVNAYNEHARRPAPRITAL